MGSTLVLECPDAKNQPQLPEGRRAAVEIKSSTQTLEPTTAVTVLIDQ